VAWTGPSDAMPAMAERLDQPELLRRLDALQRRRG
jgi:hypothetical protein